jgi:mRNA interferase RelE/StbE
LPDWSRGQAILSHVKTIIVTLSAAEDLDALRQDAREQVEASLHWYAVMVHGDVKALRGRSGYRLRIGSCRVIFDGDATAILAILHWPPGDDGLQEEFRP